MHHKSSAQVSISSQTRPWSRPLDGPLSTLGWSTSREAGSRFADLADLRSGAGPDGSDPTMFRPSKTDNPCQTPFHGRHRITQSVWSRGHFWGVHLHTSLPFTTHFSQGVHYRSYTLSIEASYYTIIGSVKIQRKVMIFNLMFFCRFASITNGIFFGTYRIQLMQ